MWGEMLKKYGGVWLVLLKFNEYHNIFILFNN